MAEEKRFLKGLFKDSGHIDQMKGSWRHALDMFMNDKEGTLSNEGGTIAKGQTHIDKYFSVASGQYNKVLGAVEVPDDKVVLFMCEIDPTKTSAGIDHIAIWDGTTGVYELLYWPTATNNKLNFRTSHPIEGTFKVDSKGDLVVYWTDDLNPPRAFNVNRQIREVPNVFIRNKLYNINPATSHKRHGDLLNLFPNSGPVPRIELDDVLSGRYQKSIIEGGGLRTAVYYLAVAYIDADLVATNYLSVSNPVSIVEEYDHTRPTTKKDGAKDGTQTSKAIKWKLSNLNTDYERLRPTVIRKMGDEIKAIKLKDIEFISKSGLEVVYSGVEGAASGDLDKVIIDTVGYDTAKTISQLDGVLYVGNTTGTKDVGYQKYANNIKLNSVAHDIENFDDYYATVDNLTTGFQGQPVDKFADVQQVVDATTSYRYVPNIYKYKGYMRSEVYAFYIAFIMNDGSMSYGYHIPGRDLIDVGGTTINLKELAQPSGFGTASDFKELSEGYAKNFHFFEYSFTGGAWAGLGTMKMNYWQNATEFYPNTSDFEIWDQTGLIGSLKQKNVRHHHMPSNENDGRKSIMEDHGCLTTKSAGIGLTSITAWTGQLRFNRNNYQHESTHLPPTVGSALRCTFNNPSGANDPAMEAALWNGTNTFTADQTMSVTVQYKTTYHKTGSNDPTTKAHVWKTTATATTRHIGDTTTFGGWGDCGNDYWDVRVDYNSNSGYTTNLVAGDQLTVRSYKDGTYGPGVYHAGTKCVDSGCGLGYFIIDVTANSANIPGDVYNDAKISHTVSRLGFTLKDIKIPDTIADKVQGFRIYYAKRKHSDRTILGQAAIIPMVPKNAAIGLCKEAGGDSEAMQVLASTQTEPESFYSVMPWAGSTWSFGEVYQQLKDNDGLLYTHTSTSNGVNHNYSMMAFSFHDFYLLRTKNSLAGATHISHQYQVKNLVWNGPSLDQDKRMNTKLVKDKNTNPEILMPREEWGWDAAKNCYAQKINSSIHIGMYYRTGYRAMTSGSSNATYRFPRLLGQKAKTYLKGDSIFNGKSLGFGGKLVNLFGESSIAFKLKDNHGIDPQGALNAAGYGNCLNTPMYTMGSFTPFCTAADASCGGYAPLTSCSGFPTTATAVNNWGVWGFNSSIAPPLLINASNNAGGGPVGTRSTYHIFNLEAFKTDVYKSIDSQELIWTGFEVLGDDLDNFIFTESTNQPLTNTHNGETADYRITTLQGSNWQNLPDIDTGIFGGDTYLCRYGVVTSLTQSDITSDSRPRKAIHYHIVESTDNINFRHIESDNSLYFPATPAKDLLRLAGQIDFTDQENIKYNKNYSEQNDIRVAFPLPLSETKQLDFPTRVHRSAKNDTSSLIDNYRVFLSNQFKDLPKNRGDLWKLASFNNLLYFHMEESLLKTQGKQTMEMKDGSEAYVGSGDIFKQEPSEIVLTDDGYGGCTSQWSVLTTRFGHFFVDVDSKKVFLMKDKLTELSDLGMKKWFRKNLHFQLEDYGWKSKDFDNPIDGFGLHSVWDPKHRRIILTKREYILTQSGQNLFANGLSNVVGADYITFNTTNKRFYYHDHQGGGMYLTTAIAWDNHNYFAVAGWTISYYPELNIWVSLHSYVPYIYFNTSTNFYSLTDQYPIVDGLLTAGSISALVGSELGNGTIWEHNSNRRGLIYQEDPASVSIHDTPLTSLEHFVADYKPFEIEYIHNELRNVTTLTSSIAYTLDVYNAAGIRVLEHGFTSYFLYNTLQISGLHTTPLEYLVNTRKIGNNWKINRFRDMAAIAIDTSAYYVSTNTNTIGTLNVGTITTSTTNPMFLYTGVIKYPNPVYIDLTKNWSTQKKFIDKWIGIRLIYDNVSNNLLNLYSTTVESRIMTR